MLSDNEEGNGRTSPSSDEERSDSNERSTNSSDSGDESAAHNRPVDNAIDNDGDKSAGDASASERDREGGNDRDDASASAMNADRSNVDREDEDGASYTDAAILLGYHDYQLLLRALVALEAQRAQVLKDIDALAATKTSATADPLAFADALRRRALRFPEPQRVVAVPPVDMSILSSHGHMTRSQMGTIPGGKRRETPHQPSRLSSLKTEPQSPAVSPSPAVSAVAGGSGGGEGPLRSPTGGHPGHLSAALQSASDSQVVQAALPQRIGVITSSLSQATAQVSFRGPDGHEATLLREPRPGELVRGRYYDPAKPRTFNLPWTAEEQAHLEELLVRFPSEEVETNRFLKISREMKTRTPRQVASRVQKFFIKLAKAGLPVPGRVPNYAAHARSRPVTKRKRGGGGGGAGYESYAAPEVPMSDDDDDGGSNDESMDPSVRDSEDYKELVRLRRLKKKRAREQTVTMDSAHLGYRCDGCGMDPIVGVRWKCLECPEENEIDLCEGCYGKQWENDIHLKDHKLEKIATPEAPYFMDDAYTNFFEGDYNYLDPNFIPTANREHDRD